MKVVRVLAILLTAYFALGGAVHYWVLPIVISPDYYPRVGDRFRDRSSGEEVAIVKRENGMSWITATLAPNGSGPPAHVHTSFDERIVLVEGSATAVIDGETFHLGPGDTLDIPKGAVHQFFNETSAAALARHPVHLEDAFPDRLMLCLSQIWGMTNDAAFLEKHMMAAQMSLWAPLCDTWDGSAPIWAQRLLFYLAAPTARLLGYRGAYEAYVPHDL